MEYAAFSCVHKTAELINHASWYQKYSTLETVIAGLFILSYLFGLYIYTVSLKLVWSFLLHQNQKGGLT